MRSFMVLAALLLTSACAWTSETVAIQRPTIPVTAVPGANAVTVVVTASDSRQEREISHKKNGYGMRGADITATNDVVAEIRAGIQDIVRGQGFREGPGGATITVDVSRFYSSFDMGFWSASANAQATASVTVNGPDGRGLYARVYSGSHLLPGVQIMTGDNAGNSLRLAMEALLRQVADDGQLTRALLQSVPPTPQRPEPRRRGAGA